MAVILCKELFPGRRGKDGIERKLQHTRVFEVLTDDPNDDDYIAGAGDGVTIPRNGDAHPSDPFATMTSITADNDDEIPTRWLVICEYTTELPTVQAREAGGYDSSGASQLGGQGSSAGVPGNPAARDDDPTTRPTRWSSSSDRFQEVARRCVTGKKPDDLDGAITWPWGLDIVNSAGMPFAEPVMREASRTIYTAVKNYPIGHPVLDLGNDENYRDHVNTASWYGRAAETVLCVTYDVVWKFENSIPFGEVTFQFKSNPAGWNAELRDTGFYEYFSGAWFPLDQPEGSGREPTSAVDLDGAGVRNVSGPPLVPVYLKFGLYDNADFSALGL